MSTPPPDTPHAASDAEVPTAFAQHMKALAQAYEEAEGWWVQHHQARFTGLARREYVSPSGTPAPVRSAVEPDDAEPSGPQEKPTQALYAGAGVLTVAGVADRLGVSMGTARQYLKDGRITATAKDGSEMTAYKVGNIWRIREDAVEGWLAAGGMDKRHRGSHAESPQPAVGWDGRGPSF